MAALSHGGTSIGDTRPVARMRPAAARSGSVSVSGTGAMAATMRPRASARGRSAGAGGGARPVPERDGGSVIGEPGELLGCVDVAERRRVVEVDGGSRQRRIPAA